MSRYKKHKAKWIKCERCQLAENRSRVVLARGTIPAPVLFVGEAPGASEDVLGKPFIGPAGKLLDRILEASMEDVKYAITNCVACIPRDEGGKMGEPPKYALDSCLPRLEEMLDMVHPKVIVALGTVSQKHLAKHFFGAPIAGVYHPAAILRMDASQRGLAIQKVVVTISDLIQDIKGYD